jgi:sulfatase maturation enzyme AslB (radical SAM superfamily)
MGNILVTNVCNRRCPYCFAHEKTRRPGAKSDIRPQYMSLSALEEVVEFLKRSDLKVFSMMGGEPTLHPDFAEILDIACHQGFVVRIFSNGLMPRSALDSLAESDPEQVKITINVGWLDEGQPREKKKLFGSLKRLGSRAALSYTIYQDDPHMDFLPELIQEYHLHRFIRLGISQPIVGSDNVYLRKEMYPYIGSRIVGFAEMCERQDIRVGFDCGFVLCMFTPEELGRLLYCGVDVKFLCDPIIDIGPNLDVWSCFALSTLYNTRLDDFANRQEAISYYRRKLLPYRSFGLFDKCPECSHYKKNRCSGGCVSHVIRAFQGS